jgi:hypothetical protein
MSYRRPMHKFISSGEGILQADKLRYGAMYHELVTDYKRWRGSLRDWQNLLTGGIILKGGILC